MLYKKEPYNMLVVAFLFYLFFGSILYGVMQGEAFYDDNELWKSLDMGDFCPNIQRFPCVICERHCSKYKRE